MRASVPEKCRPHARKHAPQRVPTYRENSASLCSTPFPQLFPHLHESLHLPQAWRPAVDQPAIAVRLLIKVSNRSQSQMCEVMPRFLQVLLAQYFHLLAIRTPGHGKTTLAYSPVVRLSGGSILGKGTRRRGSQPLIDRGGTLSNRIRKIDNFNFPISHSNGIYSVWGQVNLDLQRVGRVGYSSRSYSTEGNSCLAVHRLE